jgi:hypothetical protein
VTWKPDYVTAAGLRSYLRIDDSADDVFLALWITTVSRNIDDFCGRQFGQVAAAEERVYPPVWDRHEQAWFVDVDDVQDVTGFGLVDADGTAIAAQTSTVDGYTLLPRNAVAKGQPYTQLKITVNPGDEVTADALWGWTAVPSAVAAGLYLQAARLSARRDSPFGIAGSPSEGSEMRLLAQLDPDFRTSLKPYVRKWWAA